MEPIELLETWLFFACLLKMKGCIQVWSLLGGLLSLQSCQDICAWACVGDPNLQFGEACENPEFWYNLLTDPMSSIMKWVSYRKVEGWFIVSQWVKTEKKKLLLALPQNYQFWTQLLLHLETGDYKWMHFRIGKNWWKTRYRASFWTFSLFLNFKKIKGWKFNQEFKENCLLDLPAYKTSSYRWYHGSTKTASLFSETGNNMEEWFLCREGFLELRVALFDDELRPNKWDGSLV